MMLEIPDFRRIGLNKYPNKNFKKPRQRAENKSPNIFLKFASEQEIYSFSEKLKQSKMLENLKICSLKNVCHHA